MFIQAKCAKSDHNNFATSRHCSVLRDGSLAENHPTYLTSLTSYLVRIIRFASHRETLPSTRVWKTMKVHFLRAEIARGWVLEDWQRKAFLVVFASPGAVFLFFNCYRKDIVHYTRLAAISQHFPPSLVFRIAVDSLGLSPFPHFVCHLRPVLPWMPCLVVSDNFPSALLLLKQFGQHREEREEPDFADPLPLIHWIMAALPSKFRQQSMLLWR